MRVVGRPEEAPAADRIAERDPEAIFLERRRDLRTEVVARLAGELRLEGAELLAGVIETVEVMRDPSDVVLYGDDAEARMSLEHATEDHLRDRSLRGVMREHVRDGEDARGPGERDGAGAEVETER